MAPPAPQTGKLNLVYFSALGVLLFLLPLVNFLLLQKRIVVDFAGEDAGALTLRNLERSGRRAGGFQMSCGPDCFFLTGDLSSRSPDGGDLTWENYPYLLLTTDPLEEDLPASLLWIPWAQDRRAFTRPAILKAGEERHLINVNHIDVGRRIVQLRGPFARIGLQFEGQLTIRKLELVSALDPLTLAGSHIADFLTVEPLTAYSINYMLSAFINGIPLLPIVGLLALFRVALLALFPPANRRVEVWAVIVGAFLVLELPYLNTLIHQLPPHLARNALHADLHRERQSRFGPEFAELAARLEERVPRGERVFFPKSTVTPALVEKNWMEFHFLGEYRPVGLSEAAYVFLFHPEGYAVDLTAGRLRSAGSEPPVRVEPLVVSSEAVCLLKVIRDP